MASLHPMCGAISADSVSLNMQTDYGSRRLHIPQCVAEEDLADDNLTVLTAQLLKVTPVSQISLEQVAHIVSAAVFDQHALRQQRVQSLTGQKVRCTGSRLPLLHLRGVKQYRADFMCENMKGQKLHWLPGIRLPCLSSVPAGHCCDTAGGSGLGCLLAITRHTALAAETADKGGAKYCISLAAEGSHQGHQKGAGQAREGKTQSCEGST